MRVSKLWYELPGFFYAGSDAIAYVVGTGPSMKFFPKKFFKGKNTIGLNQAWRYGNMDYCVTIHPELIVQYEAEKKEPDQKTEWICKAGKAPLKLHKDDKRYWVFNHVKVATNRCDWNDFARTDDRLFVGRGIHQTGMHVAANLGAKTIILVGCDMGAIGNDHHGHKQHVRFHGQDPDDAYLEYRLWADKARQKLRELRGVEVLTLSPFLGLYNAKEDAERLREQLGIEAAKEPPRDTSRYKRSQIDQP